MWNMFKVNNKDTRTTPVVSLWWTLNIFHTSCSNVFIVNFEDVIVGWVNPSCFLLLPEWFLLRLFCHTYFCYPRLENSHGSSSTLSFSEISIVHGPWFMKVIWAFKSGIAWWLTGSWKMCSFLTFYGSWQNLLFL